MSEYKLVPVESIRRAMDALERFADDTMAGRNSAHELRELLAAAPAVQGEPLEALYECIAEAHDACLDDDHWVCRDKLMGALDGIQQLRNKESK